MKIVVTGGIGSGKSKVCSLLADELKTYNIFNVDDLVRELYSNKKICEQLWSEFGTCDRSKISLIVFSYPEKMTKLEKIFEHEMTKRVQNLIDSYNDFILEFPLLVEKGSHFIPMFDFIITVSAPPSLQLERATKRDGKSKDATLAVMESQTTDEKRFLISDAIIYNGLKAEKDVKYLKQEISAALEKMHKNHLKGKKIGIVSGSFDPITLGHTWVIQRALDIVDNVVVAIATNPTKKYLLDDNARMKLVECTLREVLTEDQLLRVSVSFIPSNELIVNYAAEMGAKFIFRGLRGATDLEYENQLNLLQKKIAPEIETIFLLTPRELIEISSSLIKSLLALREWERVAAPYVSKCVLEKLKEITS